jgi:predicted aspartyl protease
MFDVYTAIVKWHGQDQRVFVSATIGVSLIGMALLEGSEVKMQVKPGGDVTITRLD